MRIEPYLFLDGRCEEAIDFHRRSPGAEVLMPMRSSEAPADGGPPPEDCTPPPSGSGDKVLHAALRIGGTTVMLSDVMCGGKPAVQGRVAADQRRRRCGGRARIRGTGRRRTGAGAAGAQLLRHPLRHVLAAPFGVDWMVVADEGLDGHTWEMFHMAARPPG